MNEYGICPKCGECLTAHWSFKGNCIQVYCYKCDVVYSFPDRENLTLKWAREDKLEERMKDAAPDMLKQLQKWVDAVDKCNCTWLSEMFPDDPEITCNTCDTLALIAKIEEV